MGALLDDPHRVGEALRGGSVPASTPHAATPPRIVTDGPKQTVAFARQSNRRHVR
jgi:hypothetical protein